LNTLTADLPGPAKQILGAALATAMGAAGGGAAGAVGAFNEDMNNRQLHMPEKWLALKLRAKAKTIGLNYSLSEIEDALRWSNFKGENASSNTYINTTKDALLKGLVGDIYASKVFDKMIPGVNTDARITYIFAGTEEGQPTLIQNMNQIPKPSRELIAFIQSNSKGYSWDESSIHMEETEKNPITAWTSEGYVRITDPSTAEDSLNHQSITINNSALTIPTAFCPPSNCTANSSIALSSTNARDTQLLQTYSNEIEREGEKKFVRLGVSIGGAYLTPTSIPSLLLTSTGLAAIESSLSQLIDGPWSARQTLTDTAINSGIALATITTGLIGTKILNNIIETQSPSRIQDLIQNSTLTEKKLLSPTSLPPPVAKEHISSTPNNEPLHYDIANWADYGLPSDGYFVRTLSPQQYRDIASGRQISFSGKPTEAYPEGMGFIGAAEEVRFIKSGEEYRKALKLDYTPTFLLEFQLADPAGLQNVLSAPYNEFVRGGLTGAGFREWNLPGISSTHIINPKPIILK
ncbi:MAG TPA: hypothetical protein PLG52_11975, partial [Anaerolineales bacterium]|nr:hypothetical protein [Anaerolineales bacterium]